MAAMGALVLFYVFVSRIFTVDDILYHYTEAMGGAQKLNNIQSMQIEGTRKEANQSAVFRIIKVHTSLYYARYMIHDFYRGTLIKPGKGWSFSAETYEPVQLSTAQMALMQNELLLFNALIHHRERGYKIIYEGKEWVYTTMCYRLRVKSGDSHAGVYFIDTKTHLLIQVSLHISVPGRYISGSSEIILHYGDYVDFNGITYPSRIEKQSVHESYSMRIQSIQWNPDIPDLLEGISWADELNKTGSGIQ